MLRSRLRGARGSLFQDQLLERQVRHSLAQPVVLFLKLLEAFHLIALQATKLLAPPNGMDGSPSTSQAESLQEEGELQ